MVARVQLHHMRHDHNETIRSFGTRLCGQAGVRKFLIRCPGCNTDVNYTENILRDVLTRGLANSEIQLDLLGDKNQDMTLEEVFQFIEAKEDGKRSAGRLLENQGSDAARSQYRRSKQEELKNRKFDNKNELCSYCGKRGHGKSAPPKTRKSDRPAYGKTCDHCGRANHFEAVCRSKDKPRNPAPSSDGTRETEGAIFDALCTTTNLNRDRSKHVIKL